jgi:hypothetical protein
MCYVLRSKAVPVIRNESLLTICIVVSICGYVVGADAPAPRLPPLKDLSGNDKVSLIEALLAWRDGVLSDCSYKMTEEEVSVDLRDHSSLLVVRNSRHVIRSGRKMFEHVAQTAEDGKSTEVESFCAWDGERATIRTHWQDRNLYDSGMISDHEPKSLRQCGYHRMLGVRMPGQRAAGATLSEWFTLVAHKKESMCTVEMGVDAAKDMLVVKLVSNGLRTYTMWLDPAKDYMMLRFIDDYVAKDGGRQTCSMEVTGSKQVEGLWVPTKVTQVDTTSVAPNDSSEHRFEVTEFSREKSDAKDMEVVFPQGTHVVDNIKGTAFRVLKDGKTEAIPFYDGQAGRIIGPTRNPATTTTSPR